MTSGLSSSVRKRMALLRLHEGVRRKPYRDTTGHWTIGVGRNLSAKGLHDDEIEMLLANDMAEAELDLLVLCPWASALDPVRYAVLAELMFNMGRATLAKFRPTLEAIRVGDYGYAADRLLKTKWARDVKATRAGRLTTMLRTGQWPPEVRDA